METHQLRETMKQLLVSPESSMNQTPDQHTTLVDQEIWPLSQCGPGVPPKVISVCLGEGDGQGGVSGMERRGGEERRRGGGNKTVLMQLSSFLSSVLFYLDINFRT